MNLSWQLLPRLLGVLLCASSAVGCRSFHTSAIDDLAVVGIDLVTADTPDLPPRVRNMAASTGTLLRIHVSTRHDIGEIAQRHELYLYEDIFVCPIGGAVQLRTGLGIFMKQIQVDYISGSLEERERYRLRLAEMRDEKNYANVFQLYALIRRNRTGPDLRPFDLRQAPQDICVRIGGGGGLFGGALISNVVKISNKEIARLLNNEKM